MIALIILFAIIIIFVAWSLVSIASFDREINKNLHNLSKASNREKRRRRTTHKKEYNNKVFKSDHKRQVGRY